MLPRLDVNIVIGKMATTSRKRMRPDDIIDCLDGSDDDLSFNESDLDSEDSSEDNESGRDVASDSEEKLSGSEGEASDGGAGDAGLDTDGWRKWEANDAEFPKIPFTARNPGYQVPFPRPNTELEFFQMFFTDDLLLEITTETNRYAAEKILKETPLRKRSMWVSWTNVTLDEMKAFLGVCLNMAMHDKPDLQAYFSDEWPTRQPFFKDVFTRTRFLQIFWAFHLNPPQQPRPAGVQPRGQKVKNVFDYMNTKCTENFIPGQQIAIDESTVGFKGRIVFKMYNPQKPTKWGLRVYVLADCATGYVSVLVPYYGAPTTLQLVRPDLPFTARIVLHMCHLLLQSTNGTGYHLYTDRFYTGYDLSLELLGLGIHTTGTIIANRKGLPKEIKRNKKLKLAKHTVVSFRKADKVTVLAWKDKRNVFMLSTYHNADTEAVTRKVSRGVEEVFQKPKAIIDYTRHMGAVDRADHYCASYGFTRKSLKWWRKMFFWLFEVAVVNSFILFNLHREQIGLKPVSHLTYRKALIVQMVGDIRNISALRRGRPSSGDVEERLNKQPHFIAVTEKKSSKDCAVCSDRKVKGGRRETNFYCETCTRKPGLHPGNCFKKYHTEKKYRQ